MKKPPNSPMANKSKSTRQVAGNASKAIIDKSVTIPDGTSIGYDKDHDIARGFSVTDSGITVVGKGHVVTP